MNNYYLLGKKDDVDIPVMLLRSQNHFCDVLIWNETGVMEKLEGMFADENAILVLAFRDLKFSAEMKTFLLGISHLKDEVVIEFYRLLQATVPTMNCKRIMESALKRPISGIVLGTSYAEVGIIPNYLDKTYVNLALASQDIYYNFKTFRFVLQNYPQFFGGLDSVVIEMYDYTYFDYDTSLGNAALSYYRWGGIDDPHNFSENKNYTYTYEMVQDDIAYKKYKEITMRHVDLWQELFFEPYQWKDYRQLCLTDYSDRIHMLSAEKNMGVCGTSTAVLHRVFPETFKENRRIFLILWILFAKLYPRFRYI